MCGFLRRIQLKVFDIGRSVRFDFLQQMELALLHIEFIDDGLDFGVV